MILLKYSNSVSKTMGNNSVHVLATFLLTDAKLICSIIRALSYTKKYTSQGFQAVFG